MSYERCAELSYIIDELRPRFDEPLRYLDIGSGGKSPLPTFLLHHTCWDISCVDKCEWVWRQEDFARRAMKGRRFEERFHVAQQDILTTALPEEVFDVITNVSVIEHCEGDLDARAMAASASLLKPGGIYILTTLVNEKFFKEYYVERDVYGEGFSHKPIYYQRHYDVPAITRRLIVPSGLQEVRRTYFGDYGFQCFERLFQRRSKFVRCFYHWAQPHFAQRFLSYNDRPVSEEGMHVNTASGVILVLIKAR
jgi:SAM-dependent methyltransferase